MAVLWLIACFVCPRSVTEAEQCLRDLHAADPGSLGPNLALLPREIVGRLAQDNKEFRMASVVLRMDRDAALPTLRISRPGNLESLESIVFGITGSWPILPAPADDDEPGYTRAKRKSNHWFSVF